MLQEAASRGTPGRRWRLWSGTRPGRLKRRTPAATLPDAHADQTAPNQPNGTPLPGAGQEATQGPGHGKGRGRWRGAGRSGGRGSGGGGAPAFEGRALSDLDPGERCRIFALHGRGAVRHRLLDLGLVPNAEVEIVRRAPLADPIEVRLGDSFLTLRRNEAARVEVVPV